MKKILLFLLISITTNLFSQNEKAITIHQPQSFRLVSKTKAIVGTNAKVILDVKLPPNTIRWFYSFTATRNKGQIKRTQNKLNLVGQLTKIIDQSGTTAKALSLLSSPPGDNYCNIYLMSTYRDAKKFEKELNLDGFSYIRNGSRKNYKSGVIEITSPEYCKGTQYIGITNPDGFYGVSFAIEVVAIVLEGWKGDDKQKFHNAISDLMISNGALEYLNENQVKELTTCMLTKFTSKFTPQDLEHKANYEIESEFELIAKKCSNELGLDKIEKKELTQIETKSKKSNITQPSKEILIGTWKDNNSTFILLRNGRFHIKWTNQSQAWGNWYLENGLLYIKIGKGQKFIPQKFLSFSKDKFTFKAEGDNTIYTAKRVKKIKDEKPTMHTRSLPAKAGNDGYARPFGAINEKINDMNLNPYSIARVFDNTAPQSAWAYVENKENPFLDWGAESYFIDFVNTFINAYKIQTPIPRDIEGDDHIHEPFIKMWQEEGRTFPDSSELNINIGAYTLLEDFLVSIKSTPGKWASFITFQWTPEITPAFKIRRNNWESEIKTASETLQSLNKQEHIDSLESLKKLLGEKLDNLDKEKGIDAQYQIEYQKIGRENYAIAYAYDWFMRGSSYAKRFPNSLIKFHNLRNNINHGNNIENENMFEVNWGKLFLFYLNNGILDRNESICDKLRELRFAAQKGKMHDQLVEYNRQFGGKGRSSDMEMKQNKLKQIIFEPLLNSNIVPEYKSQKKFGNHLDALKDGVKGIEEIVDLTLTIPLYILKRAGRSKPIRSVVGRNLSRHFPDYCFKLFDVPTIERA